MANRLTNSPRLRPMRHSLWDNAKEEQWARECTERVNRAVSEFNSILPEPPEAMFEHLYAAMPESLEEQRVAAAQTKRTEGHG